MRLGAASAPAHPLLAVWGMRRSGNHVVIDWLRRNMAAPGVFLNDCRSGDPYANFEMMETQEGARHGASFRRTPWFAAFPRDRRIWPHIVSYEDQDPTGAGEPEGWAAPRWRRVVLRRSFLNWLASYCRLVLGRQRNTRWGCREPEEVAARFALYAAHLRAAGDAAALGICFDRWLTDTAYRRRLLVALELPGRDESLGVQSRYGGGSSFEPGSAPPDPGALTSRWRRMAGDPVFRRLCTLAAADAGLKAALARVYPADLWRLKRLSGGCCMGAMRP